MSYRVINRRAVETHTAGGLTGGRWSGMAFGLVILALALAPGRVEAQYYQAIIEDSPYQPIPIPGGQAETVITDWCGWGYGSCSPNSVDQFRDIPLPFSVGFFGTQYTELRVLNDGTITFDPNVGTTTTRTMREIPSTASLPWSFAAVWWDQVTCNNSPGGPLKTQVVGQAPNRRFVVEWNHCRRYASSGEFTAQVWFSEGSDEVVMHYGPLTGTAWQAGMGVENSDGTDGTSGPSPATGQPCTPNCGPNDFPKDKKVTYSSGAAIRVEDLTGPDEGFAGISLPLNFSLSNPGSKPAESFTVQYWVNSEPEISPQAYSMGYDERRWSLDPQQRITVFAEPRLPIELEEGQYYVIVEADPHHDVELSNRGGTVGIYGPFNLGIRAPNLNAPWVDAPDLVRPGEAVDVRWIARNSGNLLATSVDFRVVLERARFLSPASPTLATGMVDSLDMGEEKLMSTEVRIPTETEPGHYYIGVEVNPDREIFEHERRDNFGFSLPVVVSDQDLVVVTKNLPLGHIHGHYEVRLVAAGGNGSHLWRVREGNTLPPGLRLETRESDLGEVATFLVGQPGAVGHFPISFVVSSGPLSTEAELHLEISAAEYGLSISTESLAEASFGFEYHDRLSAMGGLPPYTWEVMREDALPHGVFLRSDGVLSGRPQEDGPFEIPVRVTDRDGRQATKDLLLEVASPSTLTCVTQELPELTVGGFFQHQLLAAGGRKRGDGTYVWTHQSLLRLAQELGEVSGPVRKDLGLSLEPNGMIHGEPKLFGTFLWTVQVSDDTPGAQGVNCPILVRIPHDRGLTVVTQQLPAALAGRSYRAQLEASGGAGDITWSEYGSNRLLDELKLEFDATGNLVGTPSLDALQGEAEKEFSITVRAEDEMGRIGIGVVNLVLKEAPHRAPAKAEDEGGCQTGSGGPVGGLILLAGLALLRRRRS